VDELVGQLAVEEGHQAGIGLDDRHLHVERGEDRGVFDADDAGAHHDELARDAGDLEDFVAIEDVLAVEADVARAIGLGADGDQEALGGIADGLAARALHFDGVGVDEAGRALDHFHTVAGELVLQYVDLVVERDGQALSQVLSADVLLGAVGQAVEAAPSRQPVRLSTVSRSVLDGMVPVCTETPPTRLPRSTTSTFLLSLAAWIAPRLPAGPEPMTIRS